MLRWITCAALAALLVGCAGMGDTTTRSDGLAAFRIATEGPEIDTIRDSHPDADGAASGGETAETPVDDAKAAMKADKSGTNPVNFTNDLRLYNEYQWLNTDGDGEQNLTTLEFRTPLLDGKLQWRIKIPYVMLEADVDDDGSDDVDENGFGDINMRFLTVPVMDMKNLFAFAVGVEVFFDTASEDVLGAGATTFGPQVFAVFFKVFDYIDLLAPAYQHRFSVDEDKGRSDVNQSLVDVFGLKMFNDKQQWILVNPTFIWDHETQDQYLLLDVEGGTMLDAFLGTTGHSVYLRPNVTFGGDRPIDYSIEVGYKVIW